MNQRIPNILEIMGIEAPEEPTPAAAPRRKVKPDPEDPMYEVVKVKKTMTPHQARRINSELALEK